MAKDLNFSLSERILRNANHKLSDCTKPPVFVFDSTEKCAGTTLKRYLRTNFSQDAFFDVDNGDPPSEKIRNYGIQCPVHFLHMVTFWMSEKQIFMTFLRYMFAIE